MMLDRVVAAWDAGRDLICRDAPHLVVTHAPKDDLTAPCACLLALAYLELAAPVARPRRLLGRLRAPGGAALAAAAEGAGLPDGDQLLRRR